MTHCMAVAACLLFRKSLRMSIFHPFYFFCIHLHPCLRGFTRFLEKKIKIRNKNILRVWKREFWLLKMFSSFKLIFIHAFPFLSRRRNDLRDLKLCNKNMWKSSAQKPCLSEKSIEPTEKGGVYYIKLSDGNFHWNCFRLLRFIKCRIYLFVYFFPNSIPCRWISIFCFTYHR